MTNPNAGPCDATGKPIRPGDVLWFVGGSIPGMASHMRCQASLYDAAVKFVGVDRVILAHEKTPTDPSRGYLSLDDAMHALREQVQSFELPARTGSRRGGER
jgi:hypothetical protein